MNSTLSQVLTSFVQDVYYLQVPQLEKQTTYRLQDTTPMMGLGGMGLYS